jgi:GNAT superfamily N-acetyltransferase
MSNSQLNYSNLIIRRANIQDLNKTIKNSINYSLVLLIPLIFIIPSIFQYGMDSLILVLIFSPFLLLGILGFIYNLGRSWSLFPIQPIHLHSWVAIYMNEHIGWADINNQKSYSVLENLQIKWGFRRKGIGSLLVLTLAEEEIKPLYVQSAYHATGFYKKLGFTPVFKADLPIRLKVSNPLFTLKDMVLR